MIHVVPKTTHQDRVSGCVEHGSNPHPCLIEEPEAELSTYIPTDMFFYGLWKDKT